MNAVLVFFVSTLALAASKPVIETTPVLSTATVLSATPATTSLSTEAAQNTPTGTVANIPESSTKTLVQGGETELTEENVKPEGSSTDAAAAASATKNKDNSKDNDSDESDSDSAESKEAIVSKPQPVDLLRKTRESRRRDERDNRHSSDLLDENENEDQPIQIVF